MMASTVDPTSQMMDRMRNGAAASAVASWASVMAVTKERQTIAEVVHVLCQRGEAIFQIFLRARRQLGSFNLLFGKADQFAHLVRSRGVAGFSNNSGHNAPPCAPVRLNLKRRFMCVKHDLK